MLKIGHAFVPRLDPKKGGKVMLDVDAHECPKCFQTDVGPYAINRKIDAAKLPTPQESNS